MHNLPFKHGLLAHSFTSTVGKKKCNGDVVSAVKQQCDGITLGPSSEPFKEGSLLFFWGRSWAIVWGMEFFHTLQSSMIL